MKLPKRYFVYKDAEIEFSKFMIEFEEKHNLTTAELLSIFGAYQQRILKYSLKAEWGEPEDELRESDG